jgi:uncharacterized protein (TIGR02118 family)
VYPAHTDARFDFDYYLKQHIPMVKDRMAEFGIGEVTVDKGVAGLLPGTPADYVCVASIQFSSLESMQQGLGRHGIEIMGDIPNYTDVQPVIQVGEVLL